MATGTSSGTVERIREELICAVCLDILREPKVLQCAHSFCRECLEKIVAQRQQPAPNYTAEPDEGANQGLTCPSCRKVTRLPEGEVNQLNTNYNLKRLAEIISDEDKQRMRDELQKRRTSVPVVDRERLPLCGAHNKHMEYFCVKCNEILCPMCLMDRHKDHEYKDLHVFLSEQLVELRTLIQPACEVTSLADSLMEKLAEDRAVILKNRDDSRETIRDFFDRMRGVLDKRERALLSTVQAYNDSKLTRIDQNHQELRKNRESITQTVQKIGHTLQQSLDVSILAERQAVAKSLSKLRESTVQLQEKVVQSSSFLIFKPDTSLEQPLSDLGTLNDCRHHPDSTLLSVNPVLVTDDEERSRYDYYNRDTKHLRPPKLCDGTLPANPHQPSPGSSVYVQKSPRPHRVSQDCVYEKLGDYIPVVAVSTVDPESPPPLPPHHPRSDQDCGATSEPENCENLGEHILHNATLEFPPPLPSNHPPSYQDRYATPGLESSKGKRRSHTLPNIKLTPQVIKPVMILDVKNFSSPFEEEVVHPCGVCCTGIHDTMAITDVHNHCVRLITSDGKFIQKFGEEGTRSGQLKKPRAIAVSADNDYICVAERGNHRIQKLELNGGKFILKSSRRMHMGSQLEDPWGVAMLPDGSTYVSDWAKNQIVVYSGSDGKQAKTIGGDFLMKPAGIAFDKHRKLIVTDQGSHCVWVLSADGFVLDKIGSKPIKRSATSRFTQSGVQPYSKREPQSGSDEPGQLRNPYGVACSEDGSIIVAESGNDRISVFSSTGEFKCCFGGSGSEPGMFNYPSHVCINSKGQILVVDEANKRIQVFELEL